ncbi:hypothetical protein ACHAXR_005565 [Thalassiosira sp. AJA248-18]
MKNTAFEEKRARSISISEGGAMDLDLSNCSKVDDIEYRCAGIQGKYSGDINEEGKPHGNGSFVRNGGTPLTYIGTWKDGDRVGNGGYYTNGRLLGNVVWE